MEEQFKLDSQLCFRLYNASRLLTQSYHPLLSEHGLTYPQYLVLLVLWEKDAQPVNDIARQMIVSLTPRGTRLREALAAVPETVGARVLCSSVTPQTMPVLFGMLDDMIAKLRENH